MKTSRAADFAALERHCKAQMYFHINSNKSIYHREMRYRYLMPSQIKASVLALSGQVRNVHAKFITMYFIRLE